MVLAACATKPHDDSMVAIDGSSTVFPISDALADAFRRSAKVKVAVNVPVGISGTRGGFRKFCAGKTDISDASRPISKEEAALCAKGGVEYIEVPIGYDGVAVVVNPKNTWAADVTTRELKTIWEPSAERRVTTWAQVREGWPDKPLRLYGAGLESGTYDYFTQAIVQKEHVSRMDFKSSESDDQLVEDVARDELALGFFGYAYLYKNASRLKALAIDDGDATNGSGPIGLTQEAVRSGAYQPLSRPLFIYVSKASLSRPEVEAFVEFYLSKCEEFVSKVGYVPLPSSAYRLARERVAARRTGSVFVGEGAEVGLSIEQLLERERAGR